MIFCVQEIVAPIEIREQDWPFESCKLLISDSG
jgi:hypothetical protein